MILKGDCIEVMAAIKPNSIDAVVTDPPYLLSFMGKDWDKDLLHEKWLTEAYRVLKPGGSMLVMGGTRTFHRLMVAIEDSGFIIKDTLMWIYGSGFPKAQDLGKMIDKRNGRKIEDFKRLGKYLKEQRLEKGLNTNDIGKKFPSKSGGITGCFRNWEYGNNVPTKSQWQLLKKELSLDDKFDWLIEREEAEREKIGNGKACFKTASEAFGGKGWGTLCEDYDITIPSTDLAKHWDGFKIGGIKPAYEPIVWAVKPPEGSYIDNVLKWGVGAVNVDATRVEYQGDNDFNKATVGFKQKDWKSTQDGWRRPWQESKDPNESRQAITTKGRFPANVILDEEAGRVMDEMSGMLKSGVLMPRKKKDSNPIRMNASKEVTSHWQGDNGGASRFFYCAKASRGERNRGLEGMEEKAGNPNLISSKTIKRGHPEPEINKPAWSENKEPRAVKNNHPTVKPIALFEWLIKLVTRNGQIVLDPFLGSGTTAIAAHKTGRECVGIEREDDYVEIAKRRIDYWESQSQQQELRA